MAVVLFVFAVIVVGVVLAALTYFVALQARYPEPAQAHEINIVSTDDGGRLRLLRRKSAQLVLLDIMLRD